MEVRPAWYDDPQQPGFQRYYDGFQWTEHVRPQPSRASAAPLGIYEQMPKKSYLLWIIFGTLVFFGLAFVGLIIGFIALSQDSPSSSDRAPSASGDSSLNSSSALPLAGPITASQAHEGKVNGSMFEPMFYAEQALLANPEGFDNAPPSERYEEFLPFQRFDETGIATVDGRYAIALSPGGTTICLSDLQENLSLAILYDANPDWNGNNAWVIPSKATFCPEVIHPVGGAYPDSYVKVELIGTELFVNSSTSDVFLGEFTTSLENTGFDKVVSSHFIGAY